MFYLLNITSWLAAHQLPCLFKAAFHVDCPGCGFQRSAIALLGGRVTESLKLYPALIPMLLFFGFLIINSKIHFRFSTIIVKSGIACIFIIILANYFIKLTTN